MVIHFLLESFLNHPSEKGQFGGENVSFGGWGALRTMGHLAHGNEVLGPPTLLFAQSCSCPIRHQKIQDKPQFEQLIQHQLTPSPGPPQLLAQLHQLWLPFNSPSLPPPCCLLPLGKLSGSPPSSWPP